MRKDKYFVVSFGILLSLLFNGCQVNKTPGDIDPTNPDDGPTQKTVSPIKLLGPAENESLSICNEAILNYLNSDDVNEQVQILKNTATKDVGAEPIRLSWESNGSANYTLSIGNEPNLEDATDYKVSGITPYYNFYNAIPNSTYYWKVKGNEKNDDSITSSFYVEDSIIRPIYASGGNNMRDIGGWRTEDNEKSVKYGMIYRGNCLNGYLSIATLNEDGIDTFVNQLGMKTEIDLRTFGSDDLSQTKNWFNEDYPYLKLTVGQYTRIFSSSICADIAATADNQSNLSSDANSKASIKSIFEALADESNYPIYLHCNSGADRTGTIAFLINGLLGVSYEDLIKDFEITSFSSKSGERLRSKLVSSGEGEDLTYSYDDSGVYMNVSGQNFVAFGALYNAMMKYYAEDGETLSQAIEKYLLNYIGLSKYSISKIKNLLLNNYHDSTYDNLIELEDRQELDLSASINSASLDDVTYTGIEKIELDGINLGNNISSIDLSGINSSGENNIFVFAKNGDDNIVIKVPVLLVTERITTMQQFKNIFEFKNNTLYGYYVLANDIGSASDYLSNDFNSDKYGSIMGYGSSRGFQGTLDGNGFTIKGKSSRTGIFGVLGSKGIIKNVNIENYFYVSNGSIQHTTIALSIYGTVQNVTINLKDNCPTEYIAARNWFGLVSTSNSENFVIKGLTINAEGFYIDSLFGGCASNGAVFDSKNIEISVTCEGIDEFAHYAATKYSLFDITHLGGNLAYTCTETNIIYRETASSSIYLGEIFEEDYSINSIECHGVNCENFTFEDGEITLPNDGWIPNGNSAELLIQLENIYGLSLKLTVLVLIY